MKKERAIKQLEELKKQGKNMRLAAEGWNEEWKTLISIILSARTRDETTIKTCTELFKKYNYQYKILSEKKLFFEKLTVYLLSLNKNSS